MENILFVLSLTFVFSACEKQDISVFTTDDCGIYFQRVTSYIYNSTTEYYGDSLAYSFASAKASIKALCCPPRYGQWERWLITIVLLK